MSHDDPIAAAADVLAAHVEVRDVHGNWIPAVAVSEIEGTHKHGTRVHDFPVIWVRVGIFHKPIPWPAGDVRTAKTTKARP